ncbi:MAG: acyl-CoA dehydratase activase [Synergistaceae bacterium]|nr:acyl-CoA dehydratase activase [Synergistaceae bacterium]
MPRYVCRLNGTEAVIGLDLGSRASKGALFTGKHIFVALTATGLYMQETADDLVRKLCDEADVARQAIRHITCTGYGRVALSFSDIPYNVVTEISCHAMGAHVLFPSVRTIIDIGGQDSKIIKINPSNGSVREFAMNDKCAAGTGQFLEKAALLLGIPLDQMGHQALRATAPADISSQCVVFAESEMISLRAKGARAGDTGTISNIAAGIHYSAARRINNLLSRLGGAEKDVALTGGVSRNQGMRQILENMAGAKFVASDFDTTFAGALGAGVFAEKKAASVRKSVAASLPFQPVKTGIIPEMENLINEAQSEFIDKKNGRKKAVYFCTYTPLEILSAAGVDYMRLFKTGDPETLSAGELHTQSVFCDFCKSSIGGFERTNPLYSAADILYSFHTCASIKRASEVIEKFLPVRFLNLPKMRNRESSRAFFAGEIRVFTQDLENLSGGQLTDDDIRERIILYNKLRVLLKRMSELRKQPYPIISGREFLELAKAYYYVPPQRLLSVYERMYLELSSEEKSQAATAPLDQSTDARPLRFMISGSIGADGDDRLLDLIEGELGARVVVEDHCAGFKPFYYTVRETGDPIRALADGYLDQAPCARMKTLEDNVKFSGLLAQEYNVDAVIHVTLKFCSCYGVTKRVFFEHFQSLGLPVLDLSHSYASSDYGQVKTRLEAMRELLRGEYGKRHAGG